MLKTSGLIVILCVAHGLRASNTDQDDDFGRSNSKAKQELTSYLKSTDSFEHNSTSKMQLLGDIDDEILEKPNTRAKQALSNYIGTSSKKAFTIGPDKPVIIQEASKKSFLENIQLGPDKLVIIQEASKKSFLENIQIGSDNVVNYPGVLGEADGKKVLAHILSLKVRDIDPSASSLSANLKFNIGGLRALNQELSSVIDQPLLKKLVIKTCDIDSQPTSYQESFEKAFTPLAQALGENFYLKSLSLDMTDLPSDLVKFSLSLLVTYLSTNDVLHDIILQGPITKTGLMGCSLLFANNNILKTLTIITPIVIDPTIIEYLSNTFEVTTELTTPEKKILVTRKDAKKPGSSKILGLLKSPKKKAQNDITKEQTCTK
jgi:hypothetical protein